MAHESGWVIEHEKSQVFAPMYFTLADTQIGWTAVSTDALRFSRLDDAKAFAAVFLAGKGRCAEHGWGP